MSKPKKQCVFSGCMLFAITKGRCSKHYLRLRRNITGNAITFKYEKTPNGFLMRLYRNMKSRVSGVQWQKYPLYVGKYLLPKEDFYCWAKSSDKFWELFADWQKSEFDRKLTPSVDRIDSALGYSIDNMQWLTHSENSAKANLDKAAA